MTCGIPWTNRPGRSRECCSGFFARVAAAFSLVELSLVMAITVVIGVIAVPRYAMAQARYRADSAARRIAADLAATQQQAAAASGARAIVFAVGGSTYSIRSGAVEASAVSLAGEPYRAAIGVADCGGDATLAIDGYGRVDSAGTIEVQAGSVGRRLKIEAGSGHVTYEWYIVTTKVSESELIVVK